MYWISLILFMLTRIIKYTTLIICASLILFFVLASLFHSMYLFSNWGICPIVSFTIIYLSSVSLLHKPRPQNAPAAPAMVSELPPSFVFSSVCLLSFWFSSSPHCLSCFQPMAIDVYHISFPQKTVVSEHGGSCVFQWKWRTIIKPHICTS